MSDYWRDLAVNMERENAQRQNDAGVCSHGRPDHQELVRELREAVGLFAGAMPVTPKEAWEEAVGRVTELEAIVRDLAATPMTDAYGVCSGVLNAENLCRFCRTWFPQGAKQAADSALHMESCPWRRARELMEGNQ